jgi:HPt (histidine-containing phosphotransfer) domain-containing protein
MKASLGSSDAASFVRAAHTIKGSSANVGASSVRSLAERLEFMSKRDGLGGVSPLIANVEAEFAKAAAELKRIAAA